MSDLSLTDAGLLAGNLYNALVKFGVEVKRVRYKMGGGWQLDLNSKGGIIRGLPIICFDSDNNCLKIKRRYIFKTKDISFLKLDGFFDVNQLADKIVHVLKNDGE